MPSIIIRIGIQTESKVLFCWNLWIDYNCKPLLTYRTPLTFVVLWRYARPAMRIHLSHIKASHAYWYSRFHHDSTHIHGAAALGGAASSRRWLEDAADLAIARPLLSPTAAFRARAGLTDFFCFKKKIKSTTSSDSRWGSFKNAIDLKLCHTICLVIYTNPTKFQSSYLIKDLNNTDSMAKMFEIKVLRKTSMLGIHDMILISSEWINLLHLVQLLVCMHSPFWPSFDFVKITQISILAIVWRSI